VVYLRATQKVLRRLPSVGPEGDDSTNALGDWFVNRVVVDRKPLLLLVSSATLFPLLHPAQEVKALPERLPELVRRRLLRAGIPESLVMAECGAMDRVTVAKTNNRSVLGSMNDFAHALPYHLPEGSDWRIRELHDAEARLARTPCRASTRHSLFPDQEAVRVLVERWGAGVSVIRDAGNEVH